MPFYIVPTLADAGGELLGQLAGLAVVAAALGLVCRKLGVVPLIGFLLAGTLAGPFALGLVREPETVDALAEIGVILLLFTIGTEFRPQRLWRLRRLIFVGGALQVAGTVAAVALVLVLVGAGWRAGVFTGCLVALSSTALVLKILEEQREVATPAGERAVAVLIFQDLAVVLMVLLLPTLAGGGGASLGGTLWALLKAALVIAGVLLGARRIVPPVLEWVASICSQEIFLLSVIALCLGTAWLTNLAGVSVALGAFLAGLLVSESRYRQHAVGEIMPLQIVFSAAFFVSVGMLLDVRVLASQWPLVLAAAAAVVALKAAVAMLGLRLLGTDWRGALAVGVLIAPVGEFAFVLQQSAGAALTPFDGGARAASVFVAAAVVLMILSPLLAAAARRISPAAFSHRRPAEPLATTAERFVLIDGYGDNGRATALRLRAGGVAVRVLTMNPLLAVRAEDDGFAVTRGSTSRRRDLEAAGAAEAAAVAIADDDAETALAAAALLRGLAPQTPVYAVLSEAAETDGLISRAYHGDDAAGKMATALAAEVGGAG